jgi:hypothetical protein
MVKGAFKNERMMKGMKEMIKNENNGERSIQELKDDEGSVKDERNDQERK